MADEHASTSTSTATTTGTATADEHAPGATGTTSSASATTTTPTWTAELPWTAGQIAMWPLLGVEVRTERLVLRPVEQQSGFELAELAAQGIHDPATMPFLIPFTDAEPGALRRSAVQFYARQIADWTAQRWNLLFVTRLAATGEVIGCQSVEAVDFATRRVVGTGSWIGQAHQGRGYGTEQRAAVLHLAFSGLGAQRAETGAWHDNAASLAVTAALGYEPNGNEVRLRRDQPDTMVRFVLTRERWHEVRGRWPGGTPTVTGLDEACLGLFGLTPTDVP